MDKKEIDKLLFLLNRYLQGEHLTLEELELLELGMNNDQFQEALDRKMSQELQDAESNGIITQQQQQGALNRLRNALQQYAELPDSPEIEDVEEKPRRVYGFRRWRLVASIVGVSLFISALYLYQFKATHAPGSITQKQPTPSILPITPGNSGAILTLGDGQEIALGTSSGKSIQIGSLNIQQDRDKASFSSLRSATDAVPYNTITTPRGKQFQVQLPDGTEVWLNASSTLKFPAVFDKNNRTVELTGEAYFEVVHNEDHPFQVKVGQQLIEDIGTKFNVKAYSDERSTITTLVEGRVDVFAQEKKVRLTPGRQLKVNEDKMVESRADLTQVLAWKSGFFSFQQASIEHIMKQVSRWYDVDIQYSTTLQRSKDTEQRYTGKIDRNLALEDLLEGLHFSQLKFKINYDKRRIIIEN